MTYKELENKRNTILNLIHQNHLSDVFIVLDELSEKCLNKDYKNQLENYKQTYSNLLKYSFELDDDPEKENVHNRLIKSMLELMDDIREDIITRYKLLHYVNIKKDLKHYSHLSDDDSVELIENLEFEREIQQILSGGSKKNISAQKHEGYQRSLRNIFKIIWLTDKIKEAENKLVKNVCNTKNLPWHDKCLLVSSLTLSVLRHFDSRKVILLFEFYECKEEKVWQRALIGLMFCLYYYENRIEFYPEIEDRLRTYKGEKSLEKNIELIIIQFIRAKETEKITKKIQEEIIPEVLKMKSKLDEKLDLENILPKQLLEEKNPEWQNFFEDSPDIYNKFEEFSHLQMEGADVFLGAFAMLKRFDFFDDLSNWFLPFYKENEAVTKSLENIKGGMDIEQFAEGLERTSFLCNSDKYSFCLNVRHLPDIQKSMMTELFNMELKAMNELAESDDLINVTSKNKAIITQYFQDLYRFFKLHPLKNEFDDVFELKFDIYNSSFYSMLVDDKKVLRNIGEFFFEKEHYNEALEIFEKICAEDKNTELFEKTAYCYQKLGNLETAISYYHKAELIETNNIWLLNKIAYLYRKLKNFDKSLEYYKACEKLEPENLQILSSLGHTYLEKGDYESALKYYFNVEYHAPDNIKIQRPISWCSFLLKKYSTAKKYIEKVIDVEGNKNDYMNLGHINWCMGDIPDAIENYRMSLRKVDSGFEWFSNVFSEDSQYLIKNGINSFDLSLMYDYLKLSDKIKE